MSVQEQAPATTEDTEVLDMYGMYPGQWGREQETTASLHVSRPLSASVAEKVANRVIQQNEATYV